LLLELSLLLLSRPQPRRARGMADALAVPATLATARLPASWATRLVLPTGVVLPDRGIFLAGALGGPLCIGSLTPLRNACTLAAQDSQSSLGQIYRRVFSHGLARGWTGATAPCAAATVQFTMLGPGYHFFLGLLGSPAGAVAAGALIENVITYGPGTRNAQLMHISVAKSEGQVAVRGLRPVGPGFCALFVRNCCANAGIRVLSEPLAGLLATASRQEASSTGPCKVGGDFLASVVCGAVSMPFNQLYNFQVTSRASLEARPTERIRVGLDFLKRQYFVCKDGGSWTLSRMVPRDAALRAVYIGCLFSSYAAVERMALALLQRA